MKKRFVIINKGKGVLKITPSNLNEVEQPLTEIEALYEYVDTKDGEVLLNSKAYTDNQITIVADAITILGSSISTVNQNLTTKIDDAVYDITEVVLPLKEDKNQKGVAGGYAPLNISGKVPAANLPLKVVSLTTPTGVPSDGDEWILYTL